MLLLTGEHSLRSIYAGLGAAIDLLWLLCVPCKAWCALCCPSFGVKPFSFLTYTTRTGMCQKSRSAPEGVSLVDQFIADRRDEADRG